MQGIQVKKKTAIVTVMALLLCVAVYLNWSYGRSVDIPDLPVSSNLMNVSDLDADDAGVFVGDTGESTDNGMTVSNADYFASARLTRQQARDEAISILKTTTDDDSASVEARDRAADDMAVLAANAVKEARIENLVKAKGYLECIVLLNDDSVSLIVPTQSSGLAAEDVARLKDIVVGETSLKSDKITIVEAK